MNGRNYDLLLSRMTTIANRHEELKQQLELMTNEEVQHILNERRNMKISTRLENYEEALKLNPLETPKVMSRRRPPELIQKAREVKWSAVAFRSVTENRLIEECTPARDSSPCRQLEDDRSAARSDNMKCAPKASSPALINKHAQSFKKSSSFEPTSLPPLLSLQEEHRSRPRHHVDVDRLHRTTAIESIRLQLQKEQLKTIQAKFDSIKSFPGYVPPPTVVYSKPEEQLQASWRIKSLHSRPERKKPWALPEDLRPRRKKKKDIIELVVEESKKVEEAPVVAAVKSAMELMMDMDDEDEDDIDVCDRADADPLPSSAEVAGQTIHAEAVRAEKSLPDDTSGCDALPVTTMPQTTDAAAYAHAPPQPLGEAQRPDTSASALSEADSVFTRDSDAVAGKKAIVLTGEATHAIVMSELPSTVDFEDILLEKVISGEEIHKISTSKADNKPFRTGDLFLLARFLKGDVMLVPESYQESESSGDEGDIDSGNGLGSRANSRGGPRSRGSKSRSRSRPSTREGDSGFVLASDFVQVAPLAIV